VLLLIAPPNPILMAHALNVNESRPRIAGFQIAFVPPARLHNAPESR
jgi:hypothetical protein